MPDIEKFRKEDLYFPPGSKIIVQVRWINAQGVTWNTRHHALKKTITRGYNNAGRKPCFVVP